MVDQKPAATQGPGCVKIMGAAFALLAAAQPALAQTQGAEASAAERAQTKSDEIIVTATRREERLSEVPLAVTALSGDTLNQKQILDFQALAAQVPGFSVQSRSAGFNQLILRGQNTGSTGASVATVIDDMPFNFVTSRGSSGLLAANVDTWDLQRIEVLRGPQGTLYGAAAQGGLIKYVTNAPVIGEKEGAFEVGYKSVDEGSSAGSVKGWVNVPVSDVLALRFSGAYDAQPGFVENPTLRSTDFNTGFRGSFRASALFEPIDDLSIRLTAFTQQIDSNGNGAVDVVGAARQPRSPQPNRFDLVNGFTQPRFNETTIDNNIQTYSLDVSWDLGWAVLQSLTSKGRLKTSFTNDITSFNAAPDLTNGQAFAPLWPVPISIRQQQSESLEKFNQEVRLSSLPGQFEWQGGVFYSTEDTTFNQFYFAYTVAERNPAPGGPPIGGSTQPVSYEEWAAFGEGTYKFTPKFDVSIGLRHTDSEQTSVSTLFPGLLYPRFSVQNSGVQDKDTTYSFSPRYKFSEDLMVYARVASGFRPGGPLFAAPPAPQFYTSDQTVNYEAGFRGSFFDDRFTADVAAYHIDWTDIQIITRVTINNITYSTVGNAGAAESKGLEWNLRVKPIDNLTLGLVGAFTEATLTESAPRLGGAAGNQLPYVPRWSYSINADYEWPAFADFEGYAGGTFSFVGPRYGDFSTAATATNHDKIPEYSNLNVQAGLRNDRHTLQVYVNNLTNEVGILNYSNEGGANQSGFANITRPRTIGVLLQTRF